MVKKQIIFFDGHCNLCSSTVRFLLRIDKKKQFNYSSLQSEFGLKMTEKYHLSPELKSIYLFDNERFYEKSKAVFRISTKLGFPWNSLQLFKVFGMRINDKVYDFVARNRYSWFGRRDKCKLDHAGYEDRFIKSL